MVPPPRIKIGEKLGMLTLEAYAGVNHNQKRLGQFRCDCGKVKVMPLAYLTKRRRATRACGCLQFRLTKGEAAFNALFSEYKINATKRDLGFELTAEEFRALTKQDCHYCGAKPSQEFIRKNFHGGYIYNGVDRVDNEIGYVKDNCVSCCGICNRSKMDGTKISYLEHCRRIAERWFVYETGPNDFVFPVEKRGIL